MTSVLCSSKDKQSACHAGDEGLIPGLGSSSGEGNVSPLQYSRLENSTVRDAWWATVHGVAELDRTEQLTHTHMPNDAAKETNLFSVSVSLFCFIDMLICIVF